MQHRTLTATLLCALLLAACTQEPASPQAQQAAAAPEAATTPAADSLPTLNGHPNLNGVWQALNGANWNLEAHSAVALDAFWQMGAIAAIPAGKSLLRGGGEIPYLPEAQALRDQNRASWPAADPEAKCYMLGIPRATYHPLPFQIIQGDSGDLLMAYPFAAATRVINMSDFTPPPIDSWMGKSDGVWEGDTLVVTTTGQNGMSWLDRAGNHSSNQLVVTERFTLMTPNHIRYEATLEDPLTYAQAWTIEMPLYRLMEENAQLLEHKCVPFADKLLYSDLLGLDGE